MKGEVKAPLFSMKNLIYRYRGSTGKDIEALSIPRLDFEEGKVYALLGPNGSGKTTLLKLMNRLLIPTEGTIRFRGNDISGNRSLREGSVYVHQNPLLFSGTVLSNLAYGLKLRKLPHDEIDRRVRRTLEVVGLRGFEKRRSNALSGGEAQRVAIARALAVEPEVLLLDEPTSSIDRKNVGQIEKLLSSIRKDYGCSIILSTHNFPFAYRMGDHLIKLEEGRIVPLDENILEGRLLDSEREYRVFRSNGVDILCPDMDGAFTKAVIDYDQILLSRELLDSSAQNNFRGTVELLSEEASHHGLTDVRVKTDGLSLTSRITNRSVKKLSLEPGREIYLSFKASSVRLY